MTNTTDLLPCPMCGGHAKDFGNLVTCQKCSLEATCAAHWNTRHAPEGYVMVPVRNLKTAIKLMRSTGCMSGWHEEADQIESMITAAQEGK